MKSHLIVVVILCALYSSVSNAAVWTEVGDAGDVPATAQQVTGNGTLTTIAGTITDNPFTHVDMFAIYLPTALAQFTAQASIPSPPIGTVGFTVQMFLFDLNGIGVYASQDPNNMFLSYNPSMAGLYYLAVSPWNIDPFGPKDEFGFDERIWLQGSSTPDGPAALLPVSGWGGTYSAVSSGYTINLTGAEFISAVPIPPAPWLFGSGLLGLVGIARRKKA